jgi:hypothetical protein
MYDDDDGVHHHHHHHHLYSLFRLLGEVWLVFSSAGPSSSSDKSKEKGSPAKVLERSGQVGSSPKTLAKKKKGKGKDSGTSSEEERWLDAIESGKLEEVRSCISFSEQMLI